MQNSTPATPQHVNDVVPFNMADLECLREIKEVLQRHDNLERFGVSLLHRHFDMADDEVLVETCDPELRRLTAQPERASSKAAKGDLMPTAISLQVELDKDYLARQPSHMTLCRFVMGEHVR